MPIPKDSDVKAESKLIYEAPHSMYDEDIQKNIKEVLDLLDLPCSAKTKKGEIAIECGSHVDSFEDAEAQLYMAKDIATTIIVIRQFQDRTVGT
jgi:hypothetical protein|tara:strand:+ start:26721 stop:27002 length:282 start_codon:yes stop_codon:yes gene_type:complete